MNPDQAGILNQTTGQPMSRRTARVLHAALLAGVFMISIALTIARTAVDINLEGAAASAVRYAGLSLLLATGIVIFKIRARLPIHQRDDDPDAWWAAHGMRVLVLWVLAEGAATMGAVFWFLTGDAAMLVVLGVSAVLLLRLRPSVWTAP